MDHLDEHLMSAAISPKYDPAIRAAVAMGKKTLNHYYDHTDHLELYCITIGMYMFTSLCQLLIQLWNQCYILATSSTTSSAWAGQPSGLPLWKRLFETSSITPIIFERTLLLPLGQQTIQLTLRQRIYLTIYQYSMPLQQAQSMNSPTTLTLWPKTSRTKRSSNGGMNTNMCSLVYIEWLSIIIPSHVSWSLVLFLLQ